MPAGISYAYADESGVVTPFSGSQFFVVTLIRTSQSSVLDLHLKRLRQKIGMFGGSGEVKASQSTPAVVEQILAVIADESISINAVVVDKRVIVRPPENAEEIYETALATALHHAATIHANLDVFIDKRYTTQRQRDALERVLRARIADLPERVVLIRQEDSIRYKGLQIADLVAWAFFQKYEREDDRFFQIIANRVDREEVIAKARW